MYSRKNGMSGIEVKNLREKEEEINKLFVRGSKKSKSRCNIIKFKILDMY